MVDAVRQLTRRQLEQFLRDHQAIRTLERMQAMVVEETPAMMEDFTAQINDLSVLASTVDARLSEAIAASNRLSDAIEALLLQPAVRETAPVDDVSPPPAIGCQCEPEMLPPVLPYDTIATQNATVIGSWTYRVPITFIGGVIPAAPAAGSVTLYSTTNQGHTGLNLIDEDGTQLRLARDSVLIVRNTSGADMVKGAVVNVTGSTGQVPTVGLADADTFALHAEAILAEDVANNAFGLAVVVGLIMGIDTSTLVEGGKIYLSQTAGLYTQTPPTAGELLQEIGVVIRSHATQGVIEVAVGGANRQFADPTATVGPTATNGTAITPMRSDAAPAINLTATYPWTGQHSYTFAGSAANPTVLLSSTQPSFVMDETDQATDEKRWVTLPSAKVLQRRSSTDNGSASIVYESITRGTGTAISNMAWGDTTNNNTYTFGSTGTATFNGRVSCTNVVVTGTTVATNGLYLPAANTVGMSANAALTARYTGTTFETLMQTLFSGTASPAQFTANQDNLAIGDVTVLRVSTDASRNLTGIAGGVAGRFLILINVGTQPLVLVHDATSTAANRFFLASSTNTTVQANGAAILWYDGTSSRWRQITRIA